MEPRPLSFRPTDIETDFMDNNNINFSTFVHEAFTTAIEGQRSQWIKEMGIYYLIMILGISLFAISYLLTNLIAWVLIIMLSFFTTCYGSIGILLEVRQYKRRRVQHSTSRV